ncbi:hypothetical protein Val02_62590 [Virgisporangium aliadipatigenens]|uniref:DUF2637 domain-containing protein n=1 Tax=Virgisporangium aliadipatigenens TaxID=741659 RepID=A0A8J3YTB3_9ACTN|nr:DUF2637 domain-containing protein [Virgisporangium aliadipatigenens]GIJ49373.1 hypothetical protein Val02_62590 [Virgisporangium aliadipatigenens]
MTAAPLPAAAHDSDAVAELRRVRWAIRAVLALGVLASTAANILHARPHPVSQAIAAWPPVALLLTIELIARVPVHHKALAACRLAATAAIAGIAAYVSYRHMAEVAARFGEGGPAAYLLPISVDGLVIVASISLVELAARIRHIEADGPQAAQLPADVADIRQQPMRPQSAAPDLDSPRNVPPEAISVHRPEVPPLTSNECNTDAEPGTGDPDGFAEDALPVATSDAVAFWLSKNPRLSAAEIAKKIGRSPRTVRRNWPKHHRANPHGQALTPDFDPPDASSRRYERAG